MNLKFLAVCIILSIFSLTLQAQISNIQSLSTITSNSLVDPSHEYIDIRQFLPDLYSSSWFYFSFAASPAYIVSKSVFTFKINLPAGQLCPLPRPIDTTVATTFSQFPVTAVPNLIERCIAVSIENTNRFPPIFAGSLEPDFTDSKCDLKFTSKSLIPPNWLVSCLVQFPFKAPTAQMQFPITLKGPHDGWSVKNSPSLPSVSPLKPALIWLDLDLNYRAKVITHKRVGVAPQRIDELALKFSSLPKNVSFKVEIAIDIIDQSHIDRLFFLPYHIAAVIADLMASTVLDSTKFAATGARLVFSRDSTFNPNNPNPTSSSDSPGGFFIVTDQNSSPTAEFKLPIPIDTILSMLVQQSSLFVDLSEWHGKQIAVYCRLQQSRLFRFDSSHHLAKWNFNTPLLHQYVHKTTQHLVVSTQKKSAENSAEDWTIDSVLIRFHIILLGASPSIQISGYNGPSTDEFSLKKLFTTVENGGFLRSSLYITSPSYSRNETQYINFSIYSQNDQEFPIYTFHFSEDEPKYSGYANATLAFDLSSLSPLKILPFSINLLINGKFPYSLSVYPNLTHEVTTSSASNDKIQFTHSFTPNSNSVYFKGSSVNNTNNQIIQRQEFSNQDFHFEIDPNDQKPTRWEFSFSKLRFFPYELRSPEKLQPKSKCSGTFSEKDILTGVDISIDVKDLCTRYQLPLEKCDSIIDSGNSDYFSGILSKDMTQWLHVETYLFPNVRFKFQCDYDLLTDLVKPSNFYTQRTISSLQGSSSIFKDFGVVESIPPIWKDAKSTNLEQQSYVLFIVAVPEPILNKEIYERVLKSFIDILKQATLRENEDSSFHSLDLTLKDIYLLSSPPSKSSVLSYQHSAEFPSVAFPGDSSNQSLYTISQFTNSSSIYLAVQLPPKADFNIEVLDAHSWLPKEQKNTTITIISASIVDENTQVVEAFFSTDGLTRPHAAPIPDHGSCFSSSQCSYSREFNLWSKCINGKCMTQFQNPELTVDQRYLLDQYQRHSSWLRSYKLPDIPEDAVEKKSSNLFKILMITLAVVVAILLIWIAIEIFRKYRKSQTAKSEPNNSDVNLLDDGDNAYQSVH